MIVTYFFLFSALSALSSFAGVAASTNETETGLIEQLFLDLSIHEVVNSLDGLSVNEPWGSQYVTAIREKRFGDAVWARYHMMGEVKDDIVLSTNQTVHQKIEEDAIGYKTHAFERYSHALSIYAETSSEDEHTDVLDLISNVKADDLSKLEERVTYGIKCSADHLAWRSSCYRVLESMSQQKILIGNKRRIYTYLSCNLRVGPLGQGADLTYNTAHLVAHLIEEQCSRCPAHCDGVKVSGYSPKNSGHRKVCLSSKPDGCY